MEALIKEYISIKSQQAELDAREDSIRDKFTALLKGNSYQDEDITISFRETTTYSYPKDIELEIKSLKAKAKQVEEFARENGQATVKSSNFGIVIKLADNK